MGSCEDGEGKLSREEIRETVRSLKNSKAGCDGTGRGGRYGNMEKGR